MPKADEDKRVQDLLDKLSVLYPDAVTALEYGSTFELLVAVILSAQCTDQQVNKITAQLFKKYNKPEDFAALEWEELAREIKGCGLYRNKSRFLVNTSRILVEKHRSQVPSEREALEALPGVGRKTANVVMSVAFDKPVMPVDTHVFRTSRRLGLSLGRTPAAVEKDLMQRIPAEKIGQMHHCLILHGRQLCRARNPRCGECNLAELCPNAYPERLMGRNIEDRIQKTE